VVPPTGWKKMYSVSLKSPKNGSRNCPFYPSEFIVFKEMGLVFHVAQTAHHAPTLMSRIGSSCISLGISADQQMLL
jgi:hypothetical protein